MKTKVFDGKDLADQKEKELIKKVKKLRGKGIIPTLTSILVSSDVASNKYLDLKKSAAKRIGCQFDIINFPNSSATTPKITEKIKELSLDSKVNGVMIQLPLPARFSEEDRDNLIKVIEPTKDVDGMRSDSFFTAPVVKAVMDAVNEANISSKKVVVVGANGFVGRKIMSNLTMEGFSTQGVDFGTKNITEIIREADALVSTTGQAGFIKADMVKDDIILIDVGAPSGDIYKSAYEKASFVSPVPGGVGPLTIYYLIENLVESVSRL